MKVHAYIINLQRANNRRESMLERLSAFPEFIPEIVKSGDAEGTSELPNPVLIPEFQKHLHARQNGATIRIGHP